MALEMKYFVLKPKGTTEYSTASRKAMRTYADQIQFINPGLCRDLREWADRENDLAIDILEKATAEGKLNE